MCGVAPVSSIVVFLQFSSLLQVFYLAANKDAEQHEPSLGELMVEALFHYLLAAGFLNLRPLVSWNTMSNTHILKVNFSLREWDFYLTCQVDNTLKKCFLSHLYPKMIKMVHMCLPQFIFYFSDNHCANLETPKAISKLCS